MNKAKIVLYIAWLQALVGFAGSLYFSEFQHFAPCVLCWYQRICLYPLVVILAVGIILKDKKMYWYAMPLAVIGWVIALYHNLLQYGVIAEVLAPCANTGVSCTEKYANYFGFITIPLLSFLAFTLIIVCLILYKKWQGIPEK
jgi:disulfide bond formation protein DsbB